MKKELRYSGYLLLASFLWGLSFAGQAAGMDHIGPFLFNALRYLLGGLVLLPLCALRRVKFKKEWFAVGISLGTVLFIASSLQQVSLLWTSAGKAGFITSFYLILVPLFSVFLGRKVEFRLWIAVLTAIFGLYLISVKSGFNIGRGELLVFIGSFFFAAHILIVDRYAPEVDAGALSAIQFFTAAAYSFPVALFREPVAGADIVKAGPAILFVGIFSCGIAYTLQILGQKHCRPTIASLIMSLESVFSVLGGWLVLHEVLNLREGIGCLLMMAAVILTQIPSRKLKEKSPA